MLNQKKIIIIIEFESAFWLTGYVYQGSVEETKPLLNRKKINSNFVITNSLRFVKESFSLDLPGRTLNIL